MTFKFSHHVFLIPHFSMKTFPITTYKTYISFYSTSYYLMADTNRVLNDFQPLFWLSATMLTISVMMYSIVFAGIHFHFKLLLQYLSNESDINASGKILASLISLGNWNSARNEIYSAIICYLIATIVSGFCWAFQNKLNSRLLKSLVLFPFLISFSIGCWYFMQALEKLQTII